jgi:hypothetical protein
VVEEIGEVTGKAGRNHGGMKNPPQDDWDNPG